MTISTDSTTGSAPGLVTDRYTTLADRFYAAWTSQDVESVLACYTPDVVYVDPTTHGPVQGRDAFGRYLTKLFDAWEMTWTGRELYPLAGVDGCAALWRATLEPAGHTGEPVTVDGMDLVLVDGDLVARNDVYFDPTPVLAMLG